jgi:hypothetical protein
MTARINVTRIEPRVTINCRADGARIDRIGIPGPPGSGGGGSGALTTLTYSPSGTYTLPTTPARPDLSLLFINGTKQVYGRDYSINGTVLSWISPDLAINSNDIIEAYLQ